MRYRIRHKTTCTYSSDIQHAQHVLHLDPRPLPWQTMRLNRIAITPTADTIAQHQDYFGNPVTYVAIEVPHSELVISVDFDVEVATRPVPAYSTTKAWDAIAEDIKAALSPTAKEANLFSFASNMVPPLPELRDYALPSFPAGRPIAEAAFDLITRIHKDFVFDPIATTIATPLSDVLRNRRGVCQDFAHLAIGCLRAMRLSARYVSGYLRTLPPPGKERLVGADASHAWLSVWCGDDLWLDLDPTNGNAGSIDLVTLAWGRDYEDVSPMSGVLIGGGQQTLVVEVDVAPLD
ncbi:MAG: transglutaminase family protein [Rhizobiales bacterium]|nr:transglutaminase family protein [Hyphomicrobiales bacterium]